MRIKKLKHVLALLLICCTLLGSGCWGRREMETQAYILVLGVDLLAPNKVRLYAQVGLPRAEPGGQGEGPMFQTITAEGIDMSDALDNMFLENTKRPDLTHLQAIVFSERLAKEGLWHVLDILRRDVNVRSNVRVAVTAEDLEKLLSVEHPLSAQPSLAIANHFEIAAQRSAMVQVELMDMVAQLLEPDREAVLPVIEVKEDKFTLGKTAVFQGDELKKIIDKEQTLGLLLWRNRVRNGVISVPQVGRERVVSFRILNSKTEVETRWVGERLHVRAYVDMLVDVIEIHGQVQVDLEDLAADYIVRRMWKVLESAQEEGADFLNIAARFRRSDPRLWKELQPRWAEVLEEADFDLRCRVHIRGQGQVR